ncbi:MAG: hypothetical protein CMG85_07715 [Marinobacter sp.]|nr:hypothetical protein [Marinobacter sp.]
MRQLQLTLMQQHTMWLIVTLTLQELQQEILLQVTIYLYNQTLVVSQYLQSLLGILYCQQM